MTEINLDAAGQPATAGADRQAPTTAEVSWERTALVEIRATVLAGIWLGVLVGGVGGRLAMLALRVLSPDSVRGVISDDGFLIGPVTLFGTYNLLALGAALGVIGASAYRWVDHWLIGPGWFRQVTTALGAGAVVGSSLVHTDGVDFQLLRPLWLAIAFFVLIPAVFGFFIGPLQRALAKPDAWVNRGRQGWILALVSVVAFPPLVVVVIIVAAARFLAAAVRASGPGHGVRDHAAVGLLVRGAWFGIALIGLLNLISDARTILA